MELTAVSWNLFHGRDFPPDRSLFTWRSRLLGREERGATHVQLNRELLAEFATVLAGAEWDIALLQECPPRFAAPLAAACGAEAHRVLTSRNSLGALRSAIARRNPDLIASGEGGSNLTLVRPTSFRCSSATNGEAKEQRKPGERSPQSLRCSLASDGGAKEQRSGVVVLERRELEIHRGRPERRAMAFTRVALGGGGSPGDDASLCVANLHATNDRPDLAADDVLHAARAAVEWAGGSPLLFGGDLNLRPVESPAAFERLRDECGLVGATAPSAIDHLLHRDLTAVEPPAAWPARRRELVLGGLRLRLSDHAPVEARLKTGRA